MTSFSYSDLSHKISSSSAYFCEFFYSRALFFLCSCYFFVFYSTSISLLDPSFILAFLFLFVVLLFFFPVSYIKKASLIFSFLMFSLSISFIYFLHFNGFSSICSDWSIFLSSTNFNFFTYIVLDRVSSLFICLTSFLSILTIGLVWQTVQIRQRLYFILLFFTQFAIVATFLVNDILLFYIFFEIVLLPMLLLVGIWGSRTRRIFATYKFFLYTLFGSFFLLCAIMYVYLLTGSTSLEVIKMFSFTALEQRLLWLAFFIAFAVKVPMFPLHSWLPEAHVEASTSGSVILAGILLKLGGYGIFRFNLHLFQDGFDFFRPVFLVVCIISVIYASLLALAQVDIKKFVAYSSIAHMNLAIAGLLTGSKLGIIGGIFSMLSHGITSSALFICAGELYGRYGSRYIGYYGGLAAFMPYFAFFFFLFTLGNIALPGTSAFVGELILMVALSNVNIALVLLVAPQVVLTASYSIWFYNRIVFGNREKQRHFAISTITYYTNINTTVDFDSREIIILFTLSFILFWYGVVPSFLINFLKSLN